MSISGNFSVYPKIDDDVCNNSINYGISKEEMDTVVKVFNKLKITIGYGFDFLSRSESEAIKQMRLRDIKEYLVKLQPTLEKLPIRVGNALVNISAVVGVVTVAGPDLAEMWPLFLEDKLEEGVELLKEVLQIHTSRYAEIEVYIDQIIKK